MGESFAMTDAVLPAAGDIREVGPRDGLQNEPPVPVADRVRLIDALAAAGVLELAHAAGRPVDAAVATCFGCPYEGDVDPAVVASYARRLVDLGADTVFFGDTTGMGSPRRVGLLLDALESAGIDLGIVG